MKPDEEEAPAPNESCAGRAGPRPYTRKLERENKSWLWALMSRILFLRRGPLFRTSIFFFPRPFFPVGVIKQAGGGCRPKAVKRPLSKPNLPGAIEMVGRTFFCLYSTGPFDAKERRYREPKRGRNSGKN